MGKRIEEHGSLPVSDLMVHAIDFILACGMHKIP